MDMCLNKRVTTEIPYWLSQECYLRNMAFETCHNIYGRGRGGGEEEEEENCM
jgi:hypothetical protein